MRWFDVEELRVKASLHYRPLPEWEFDLPQISKISWDKIQFTKSFPKEIWDRLETIKIHFLFGKTIKLYEFKEEILSTSVNYTSELDFYLGNLDKTNLLKDLHLALKM